MVATRQSSFLATTVAIETSRLAGTSDHLANVAEDIRRLAADISGLERRATDRVRGFAGQADRALRQH